MHQHVFDARVFTCFKYTTSICKNQTHEIIKCANFEQTNEINKFVMKHMETEN
jgi:hypothetical protein